MDTCIFDVLKHVWPEWKIVKRIGSGAYGTVYEAIRKDYDFESHAAIKMISVPKSQSEIDTLRTEGMTLEASKTYLQGIVKDFVNEIRLMISLEGSSNIVDVKDYRVVEKNDKLGWNIFIRMELLTPFHVYTCDKKLPELDVIKLGCDICTALEICAEQNIIHRDIKPGNILVHKNGDFKLGDFGIARKLENMTGGLSQKYTPKYMAPEVAVSQNYDSRVDLYSLGIVLYEQLNKGRIPFQAEKQISTPSDIENAVRRRNSGEALPAPCDASPAMAELILRACAYDPNMRFSSATEMKQALMRVADGTYQMAASNLDRTTSVRRALAKYDKTTSVRKAPTASNQKSAPTVNTFGSAPKKKSKMPAVIAIVLAVVLLIGAAYFVTPKLFAGKDSAASSEISSGTSKETSSETTSETVDYSEFDEKEIATIIGEAETLASEENYEGALAKIQTGLATYPKSEELQIKSNEYTSALNAHIKTDALATAETLAQAGDYLEAFNSVDQAISTIGEDEELANKAKEYEAIYVSNVIEKIDTFINEKDYDSAQNILVDAIDNFPDNESLLEKNIELENVKPTYLLQVIEPYLKASGYNDTDFLDMGGKKYSNGFKCMGCNTKTYFNLEGKYSELTFTTGIVQPTWSHATVEFIIYCDNEAIYSVEMGMGDLPTTHTVNIADCDQLIIAVNDGYNAGGTGKYGIADIMVTPKLNNSSGSESLLDKNAEIENSKSVYLLQMVEPYQTASGYNDTDFLDMGGKKYSNGFKCMGCNTKTYFNLEGKYSELTFTTGIVQPTWSHATVEFIIYCDNEAIYSVEMGMGDLPTTHTVNIADCDQLIIAVNDGYNAGGTGKYGIADIMVTPTLQLLQQSERYLKRSDIVALRTATTMLVFTVNEVANCNTGNGKIFRLCNKMLG